MNGCQKGERNSINKLLVRHQIALLLIARVGGWWFVECVSAVMGFVLSVPRERGETAIGHSQHLIESAKWNNYSISEVSYPSERCICSCSFQFQCIQLLWIVPQSAGWWVYGVIVNCLLFIEPHSWGAWVGVDSVFISTITSIGAAAVVIGYLS